MSYNSVIARGAGLMMSLAGAALAGCTYDPHPEVVARAEKILPTEQFGISLNAAPEQIALAVHAGGLSPNQQAALAMFVSRWREDGGGVVMLRAPLGARPAVSRHMEDEASTYLVKLGVPRDQVVLKGYFASPPAPLLASYGRFEARGPNCSGGWRNIQTNGSNTPYDHFGCATTANIAAMVANPRDLLAPAVETPADDSRREVVLGKYRNGQVTSSTKDSQADGKVSDTAGGG